MSACPDVVQDSKSDFATLASQDAEFAALVGHTGWIDFKDPKVIQALCKALLKRDYSLQIQLPDDRLTPYVSVRANYVRWMQELIDTTSPTYVDGYDADRTVTGIDIGTGASAIYVLLACCMRPNWRMAATDIDHESLAHAARNISLNSLEDRVRLIETSLSDPLISMSKMGLNRADFVMCNPPFYATRTEMENALTGHGKSRPPSTICTGSEAEMITEGGDLGFVTRMIEESRILVDKVKWYSAMPGKFESLVSIIAKLKDVGCSNWATRHLTPEGGRTRRWAVAWSWDTFRPSDEVARADWLTKELLVFPNEYRIPFSMHRDTTVTRCTKQMESLDLRWCWDVQNSTGLALVVLDVWSRNARRRKQKERKEYEAMLQIALSNPPKLVLKVSITSEDTIIRWMRGDDKVLFESFCGMLLKTLNSEEA